MVGDLKMTNDEIVKHFIFDLEMERFNRTTKTIFLSFSNVLGFKLVKERTYKIDVDLVRKFLKVVLKAGFTFPLNAKTYVSDDREEIILDLELKKIYILREGTICCKNYIPEYVEEYKLENDE